MLRLIWILLLVAGLSACGGGGTSSRAAPDLQITLGRGNHGSVSEVAPGQYVFMVTPVGAGE